MAGTVFGRSSRQSSRRSLRILTAAIVLLAVTTLTLLYLHHHARLISPPATYLFLDRNGTFISEQGEGDGELGFWPVRDEIPRQIEATVLAAEDKRFWSHAGVDPKAIGRAAWQNARSGKRVSGASTLAMQVARMQDPGPRSLWRKMRESLIAVALTARYGRRTVLEHYLRIVPYGNRIHGIAYAARRYFRKPIEDLSWAESAILAAVPKAPGRMNLYTYEGMKQTKDRAVRILERSHKNGWIGQDDLDIACGELSRIESLSRQTRPLSCMHALLRLDELASERGIEPSKGALPTTLDLDLQLHLHDTAWRHVEALRSHGVANVAALVVEVSTGNVLAYVGSADYYDSSAAGAIDYARVPRSSGSTLKPFIFSLGMTGCEFTGATILDDLGLFVDTGNGIFSASNYDGRFLGPMLYRYALANSRNIPAMQVLARVGVDKTLDHLQRLGLSSGEQDADHYGLGLAVGTLYVTLEDLVTAYGVLARSGSSMALNWFAGEGLVRGREQLIPEDIAQLISLFLSDPMARLPSFQRLGPLEYPFPVAVKTGTSRGYRDSWTVCYSHRYVVGVWMGRPDNQPMKRVSGSAGAAVLAQQIMLMLHGDEIDGLRDTGFLPPADYVPVRICRLSGKRATPWTSESCTEYFRPGTEPVEYSTVHRPVAIDTRNGLLATNDCPPDVVDVECFTVLPARFAVWAAEAGLKSPPAKYSPLCSDRTSSPPAMVDVTQPADGSLLLIDPESPSRMRTLGLHVTVDPPVPSVIWYVDGLPYTIVEYPYTTRWSMEPGIHTFQVACAESGVRSKQVRITVDG